MRILLSFILILFAISAFGTTYTAVNSGNWEDASTWDVMPPNTIPVGDVVVINAFFFVTIQTSDIVNNGTITVNHYAAIRTNHTSTFTNNATITVDNFSSIQTLSTSTFTNNATITVNNTSDIRTNHTSTFSNNATITVNNTSFIRTNNTGTFTNNSKITVDNSSAIVTNDTSTFYTSDPAPEFSDLTWPLTGTNGSRIYDISGGMVTLAAPPSPPSAPIPTLSEWGLILLSMSLSILGIVGIRQRVLA